MMHIATLGTQLQCYRNTAWDAFMQAGDKHVSFVEEVD